MLNLLNNTGLTNYELEQIGKQCLINFKGVYPSDSFPRIKDDEQYFSVIFNLSPHNEIGSHFIAIVHRASKTYYFDSFGKECKNKKILNFMTKFSDTIFFNNQKLQHETSVFCGLYCLAFILYMQKPKTNPLNFLKMFSRYLPYNDTFVKNYIVHAINMIVCK